MTNNAKYGKLYNWYAVSKTTNGNKNVCPTGWYVPTDAEWTVLKDYLGGSSVAGGKLKEVGTTKWKIPNTDATNISLFSVLPGGVRYYDGQFNNLESYGSWWSFSGNDEVSAWGVELSSSKCDLYRYYYSNTEGLSVRCLKD